jgi:hypothetical protein
VGGSEAKNDQGQIFFQVFYRVFELPSPRNAQKHDNKTEGKLDFCRFFYGAFGDFSARGVQKHHKNVPLNKTQILHTKKQLNQFLGRFFA